MTTMPPPVLPNAFLYEAAFIIMLAVVLDLVALLPLLRRIYFGAVLILIGIVEFALIANPRYNIALEVFTIPLITVISGVVIPVFYATRRFFSRKVGKLLLILSACIELALGIISFLYIDLWGYFTENVFDVLRVNENFLILGIILVTVAVYSLVVGIFSSMVKPKSK